MNIVQVQDQLKNFSQDQLIREMQSPSGAAPQYLVLSEIMRRQKMQQDFANRQSQGAPQSTVAEDAIAAAGVPQGGIADMARAMAPQTDMTQNTGVQTMYTGGPVKKMAAGDKIVRGGMVLTEQEDGTYRDEEGRVVRSVGEDILSGLATLRDIPSRLGGAARDFSGSFADEMNQDLAATGAAAMRRQMGEDIYGMRAGPDTSYRYPEVPAVDVSAMDRVGMALEGRAGFPTGMPTPQQLAMAAAQPNLPPAPLSAFGPGFEYGGRGSRAELRVPYLPGPAAATELNLPAFRAPAGGAGIASALQNSAAPDAYQDRLDQTARTMEELRREREPSPEREKSARQLAFEEAQAAGTTDPLAAMADPIFSGLSDFGGALAGRTVEEQAAIDAQRAAAAAGTGPAFERAGRGAPTLDELLTEEQIARVTAAQDQPTMSTSDAGGAGGAGGTGGISGAGAMSSYEQELMDTLGRREKAAEQDKWLALAQVGLNLMSSTQPTLGGALGEAGIKGVEAVRSARDQYDKDRLDLLGSLEQSRMARAAAAARAARGAGGNGKPINATMIGNIEEQLAGVTEQIARLRPPSEPSFWTGAIEDPDRAAREQLETRAAMLESVLSQAYATHGLPYLPTGIDPSTYANLSD